MGQLPLPHRSGVARREEDALGIFDYTVEDRCDGSATYTLRGDFPTLVETARVAKRLGKEERVNADGDTILDDHGNPQMYWPAIGSATCTP